MKPRTIDTLRAMVRSLKMDALHSGRYPIPVDPDKWEQRDKSRARQCLAYVRDVRRINALEDAIKTLSAASDENRMLRDEPAKLRTRLRTTAQILIEEIGADGPMNAELAAHNAAQLIKNLRVDAARATAQNKIMVAIAGIFNGWANSSADDDHEGYAKAADALLAIGDALGKPWVDHVRCKLCGGDGLTAQDTSVVCPACNGTGTEEDP